MHWAGADTGHMARGAAMKRVATWLVIGLLVLGTGKVWAEDVPDGDGGDNESRPMMMEDGPDGGDNE